MHNGQHQYLLTLVRCGSLAPQWHQAPTHAHRIFTRVDICNAIAATISTTNRRGQDVAWVRFIQERLEMFEVPRVKLAPRIGQDAASVRWCRRFHKVPNTFEIPSFPKSRPRRKAFLNYFIFLCLKSA